MTDTKTTLFMDMIREIKTEPIPEDVRALVNGCILDYVGVTLAGAYELHEKLEEFLAASAGECGEASIIGFKDKTSVYNAALINGISAHHFELDDGSRYGMVHLGAVILSALFAVAGVFHVSADNFIRGVVVGYEVTIRLAAAIQPEHKAKGYHATGTCGCLGAGAAVAVALGFDDEQIENTLGAAAASASGLLEMIEGRSQLKPFNAGKAAQNAVMAAFTGKAGFVGPQDSIGGSRGFIEVMSGGFKDQWLYRSNNEDRYAIRGIYRKPYASCRHCHASVEAALTIKRSKKIEWDQIEAINIQTYGLAVRGHDHTVVEGTGAAKMSIPFSVAAAFVMDEGGMRAVSDTAVHDERILELAKKVSVCENPDYSALVPMKRIAKLTVKLKNGDICSLEVTYPKGEPENPMNDDELKEKFRQLAFYSGKTKDYCEKLIFYTENLETHFADLLNLI